MPNQQFTKLNLGMLNTAQDATNIKEFEGSVVEGLELDQIALQTLTGSDYTNLVQGTAGLPDTTLASLGSTNFRINSGSGFVEYETAGGWLSFPTVFGSDSAALVSIGLSEDDVVSTTIRDDMDSKLLTASSDGNVDYTLNIPDDKLTFTTTAVSNTGTTNTMSTTDDMSVKMSAAAYDGSTPWTLRAQDVIDITVVEDSGALDTTVKIEYVTLDNLTPTEINVNKNELVEIVSGVEVLFVNGTYTAAETGQITITFDAIVEVNFRSDSVGNVSMELIKGIPTYVTSGISVTFDDVAYDLGEFGSVALNVDDLPDGDYGYKVSQLAEAGGIYESTGGDLPRLAPSDTDKIIIKNFDDLGERISARVPEIDVPVTSDLTSEVFRLDEGENDFIRVDLSKATNIGGAVYLDTVRIVELDSIILLDQNDENETEFNAALKNTSEKYDQIFTKDNRLFRVPFDRKDLLVYSRAGEWWGWQRENSFAFDSDIARVISVRDPSTVGGTLTSVVFTENSIYHMTGGGFEGDPYTVTKQIDDIQVEANSIVNANGTLMFTTKSSDGVYNRGDYGQKVYEYDLQTLVEVSAKIQVNSVLNSTNSVEYAELLGGDKYVMKKNSLDDLLVYHRDAEGWCVTNAASETAGTWEWKSKKFTPSIMERFKLGNARKFKMDFDGTITLTFDVWYKNSDDVNTFSIDFDSVDRVEILNYLPHIKGSIWQFTLSGENANLYNMWMVR